MDWGWRVLFAFEPCFPFPVLGLSPPPLGVLVLELEDADDFIPC